MATRSLIDTNILIYRYDERFPDKQSIASNVLREGIASGSVRIPHQAIVEFVAVTTRGKPRGPPARSRRSAPGGRGAHGPVPGSSIPTIPCCGRRYAGRAAYGLSWFDAHLWAYAEVNGIEELLSEDFQHGRLYGTVTVRNPFLAETAG